MLTNNKNVKPKRKDRPWILFLTALLWVCGSCFFHDPWEPYEPFVVAIVKSILSSNSWLIPYINPSFPYLDLQPFYFWIFAVIIKVLHLSDISHAVRIINGLIVLTLIYVMSRVGRNLLAYKNGRTTTMILISTVGFINCAYQISPKIVVMLGFVLYLFALQRMKYKPGLSIATMALALVFISINFTAQNLYIAVFVLLILPIINSHWRCKEYLMLTFGGVSIFLLFFISYAWQLRNVDQVFFNVWAIQYMHFVNLNQDILARYLQILVMLSWYLIPCGLLVIWSLYKRKKEIFLDPILTVSLILIFLMISISGISKGFLENALFPIVIPMVLIASVEVDSIKIHFVSLLNWFSITVFGFAGLVAAALYFSLDFHKPVELYNLAKRFAPNYEFRFYIWQLLLAALITLIWLFMVTRKHIRGREAISNWASGTTFVLVMFMSLCIPWFNSVLSFKSLVQSSVPYINKSEEICIASFGENKIQNAIWYYYTGLVLQPENDIDVTSCQQAIVTAPNKEIVNIEYDKWRVVWSGKRSVDKREYFLIERN